MKYFPDNPKFNLSFPVLTQIKLTKRNLSPNPAAAQSCLEANFYINPSFYLSILNFHPSPENLCTASLFPQSLTLCNWHNLFHQFRISHDWSGFKKKNLRWSNSLRGLSTHLIYPRRFFNLHCRMHQLSSVELFLRKLSRFSSFLMLVPFNHNLGSFHFIQVKRYV